MEVIMSYSANNNAGNDELNTAAEDFCFPLPEVELDKALEFPRMTALEEQFHTIDRELLNGGASEKRKEWERIAIALIRQAVSVYEVYDDEPDYREAAVFTMELVIEGFRDWL